MEQIVYMPHTWGELAMNNLIAWWWISLATWLIAGRTSSPDFPNVNSTGVKDVLKGGYDIILTKFNAAGTGLIGSRIIGGTANDGVNIAPKYSDNIVPMGQSSLRLNYGDDGRSEVIMDKTGNVYLASCTSSTDFPVTPNAFQKTNAGHAGWRVY